MVKIRKGAFHYLIPMILGGIVILVVIIFILAQVREKQVQLPEPLEYFLCEVGFCFRTGPDYINYFVVTKGLGSNITMKWLLKDSPDDPKIEDVDLFYNGSDGVVNEIRRMPCFDKNDCEMEYNLSNFDTVTVNITVIDRDDNRDSREVVVDFKEGIDMNSFWDFTTLIDYVESMLSGRFGDNQMIANYDLHKDLLLVGFNRDNVTEVCGVGGKILMPEVCEGVTCLCLCRKEAGTCKIPTRICFGFDEDVYFVGEHKILNGGGGVVYPGYGMTHYLALHGQCGLNTWDSKDIKINKTTQNSKTFIKISSVI